MKFRLPLFALMLSSIAFAESAFEVASVKPSGAPAPGSISINPGTLTMRNMSLQRLIGWAWEIPRAQMSGPDWFADTRLDITAKASDAASEAEMRLMMRTLLSERLGVRIHEERRTLNVYYLTLAKNGPRLHQPTTTDPTQLAESTGEGMPVFGKSRGLMTAEHVSMADIAEQLSEPLGAPMIDRTGLKSRYDVRLDPTGYMVAPEGKGPAGQIDPISMIMTAIPAQLGLKIESGKDTVRFVVVDAADKIPADN